jgi:hypothetical protein
MSGKTRKGNAYLRRILCQAAWAATRKKGSYKSVLSPDACTPRASESDHGAGAPHAHRDLSHAAE